MMNKEIFEVLREKSKNNVVKMADLKEASNLICKRLKGDETSFDVLEEVADMMLALDEVSSKFEPSFEEMGDYEKLVTPTNLYREGGYYEKNTIPHFFEDNQSNEKKNSVEVSGRANLGKTQKPNKGEETTSDLPPRLLTISLIGREGYVVFRLPGDDQYNQVGKATPGRAARFFERRSDFFNGELWHMRIPGATLHYNWGITGYSPTRVRPTSFLLENLGLREEFTQYRPWEAGVLLLAQALDIPTSQSFLLDLVETQGAPHERADRYSYGMRGKLKNSLKEPEEFLGENANAVLRFGVMLDNLTRAEWREVQDRVNQTKTNIFGGRNSEYKDGEKTLKALKRSVKDKLFKDLCYNNLFYAGETAKEAAKLQQRNKQVGKSERTAAHAASKAAQELAAYKYYTEVLGHEPYFLSFFPKFDVTSSIEI